MYAGHAAIALVLKARSPRTPMLAIALASYGPDWIEILLMLPHPREGMGIYTHSLAAVLCGAAVASLLYRLVIGSEGWTVIPIAWLAHFLVDLITGRKPIFSLSQPVGLDLYHVPWADAVLECALIVWACRIYATAFARDERQRRTVALLAGVLMILQLMGDVVLHHIDKLPWRPSLAREERRSHLSREVARTTLRASRMRLAFPSLTRTASGPWTSRV